MKHKRQTLSKDETDIKTPKSKSESAGGCLGGGDKCGGCQGCELPPGAACPGSVKDEEEDGVKVRPSVDTRVMVTPCLQKEDLSDGENSESLSSIPDSEGGPPEPEPGPGPDTNTAASDICAKAGQGQGQAPPGHPSPGAAGIQRVKPPRPSGGQLAPAPQLAPGKPLTPLANLSPTPKSLLAGQL